MNEQITTAKQLDALPVGSVVLSHCTGARAKYDGLAWQKRPDGDWHAAWDGNWLPGHKMLRFLGAPLTVLYRPDTPAPAPVGEDREALARTLAAADGHNGPAEVDAVWRDWLPEADSALAWFAARPSTPTVTVEGCEVCGRPDDGNCNCPLLSPPTPTVTAEQIDRAVEAMGADSPPRFMVAAVARALGFPVEVTP